MEPRTLLCVVFTVQFVLLQSAQGFTAEFTTNHTLNKLAIDTRSGLVYLGATNQLYVLHSDLTLDEAVETGPVKDNPRCSSITQSNTCVPLVGSEVLQTIETDNVNKILVIDKQHGQLITCGSVFQGICQVRNLSNIKIYHQYDGRQYFRIAANSATMSTVAFVAPGPSDPRNTDVLYVGTSYTGTDATKQLRVDIPAVSSRALVGSDTLNYAVYSDLSVKPRTSITLYKDSRKDHIVNYVTGFSSGGFSYFMTVQQSNNETKHVSKIIQICHKDDSFNSYVEMTIKCGEYNIMQAATIIQPGSSLQETSPIVIATFSKSDTQNSKTTSPTSQSAICVYTLSSIRHMFTENIKHCYKGEGYYGLKFHKTCNKIETVTINTDFCGPYDIEENNYPIAGDQPLEQAPVFHSSNNRLSAIAATTALNIYTVAFVGTSQGHIKKVLITKTSDVVRGEEFEDITIDSGQPINSDLLFGQNQTHLYAMTTHQIVKIPVQECDKLTSCSECHKDPFCGWCLLENKCSTKPSCSNSDVPKRWQSYSSSACAGITSVNPANTSISRIVQVRLTVPNLPTLSSSHNYKCLFGVTETSATVDGNEVVCQPPMAAAITQQLHSPASDHISVKLGLRSTETMVSFLQTDFDFYDCSVHVSCTSCTNALWGCHWCIHENKCTEKDVCDQTDVFVQNNNSCPHLLVSEEILVPAEIKKEILLQGSNLPEPQDGESGYECLVQLDPLLRVPATRVNSTSVKCKETKYSYSSSDDQKKVQLQVVWHGNHLIDDIRKTKVTIYKCSELGHDCSRCLSLSSSSTTAKFKCVWCSNICSYSTVCARPSTDCAPPKITKVSPMSGPVAGGTLLTISGTNLGRSYDHVQRAVTVDGKPCDVIKDKYKISIQIVCRTHSVDKPKNVEVKITVDQKSDIWHNLFEYQIPKVTSVSPKVGPRSGGTRLTINGTMLNIGSNTVVLIGSSRCKLTTPVARERLHCLTPAFDTPVNKSVIVQFDGNDVDGLGPFQFTEDPNITSIHPLTTFQAGGRMVTLQGAYFKSIQQPQMFIRRDETKSNLTGLCSKCFQNCDVRSDSVLECPFPVLPSSDLRKKRSTNNDIHTTVGFVMDGVESVRNISAYFPDVPSSLKVAPNPVYNKFKNGWRVYGGGALELQGENLDAACESSEVKVYIGTLPCKVKSLNSKILYCTPPDKQPPGVTAGHEDVNKRPIVQVTVGNLVYQLGELEYQKPGVNAGNVLWIIGVALGGGFLISVIIVILIIYKRKSTYAERQFKKMQIQLDTLESNVRNECKQAFAELQTEVSDFTSDLNVKGVPFWDFRTYTFKVLFPSYSDHPILHSTPPSVTTTFGGTDQALGQFNQLLNSKQFLLIFIRTLEEQRGFMIRDKALVASLLMVVLQDKMEYATEILKALLNELIDRSVEKKNPKLMFRRTESVVEKLLTNWMSLCMYDYLKKHAGKTMFMLYKSIKHQTEKGPVDAITSEAKYSLSEDRLLREKIDFHTLNVELTTESRQEPTLCKVLDCDTITQAKEKSLDAIYKNTPFSIRPSIYDVELEWRSGRSGHLPLQDEDCTTETKRKMKRVNTLAHYHIPDHSQMTLVHKQDNNEGIRKVHGRLEITSGSALNAIVEVEDGIKVWHLMKHDDNSSASHGPKVISEIFLTRLLATKGTLQQFIDDLFMTILRADCTLPPAVKHLFDFLDSAIKRHNIVDPEVIHTWKSNSLPLRFWVNIIKNPEFVFDIHKSNIVDSCLSVIAQTFMDSCSTVEHRLGKDSPSNKLLFAKDIPRYRQWVSQFYRNIQEMPTVTDPEMSTAMMELSMNNRLDFNVSVALRELFQYAKQYSYELLEALDDDSSGKKLRLGARFEEVLITSGEPPDY